MDIKSRIKAAKALRKTHDIDFDKSWKVGFKLQFLPKSDLQRMIGKHTTTEFDPKTHDKVETVNNKALTKEIMEVSVIGWFGVTWEWLITQVPLDITDVTDIKEELPFSHDLLFDILEESYDIETWLFNTVKDVTKFPAKRETEIKN